MSSNMSLYLLLIVQAHEFEKQVEHSPLLQINCLYIKLCKLNLAIKENMSFIFLVGSEFTYMDRENEGSF